MTKDRNHRASLTLPRELVATARDIARRRGDVLSDLVRGAILDAAKAAERGLLDLVPVAGELRKPEQPGVVSFRYACPPDEEARCAEALAAAQSTPVVVARAALESYVDARGSRLDMPLPGDPLTPWRGAPAA